MKDEIIKCEKFLKDNGVYDKIPEDLNLWGEDYLKRFREKGNDYFSKIGEAKLCYEKLSIFYKYYGEEEKAKKCSSLFHRSDFLNLGLII